MHKRLTPVSIERMRAPKDKTTETRDGAVPGLVIRATPHGTKTFSVKYKVHGEGGASKTGRLLTGKQHRITLTTRDLKEARDQARKIVAAATEGTDPRIAQREANLLRHSNTFRAVRERFVELYLKPNVKGYKTAETIYRLHVEPTWAGRPIASITRADVHDLLDALQLSGKASMAREVRKHLSNLFNWAVDRAIISASPITGMKRNDLKPKEKTRALDEAELKAVWRASSTLGYPYGSLTSL